MKTIMARGMSLADNLAPTLREHRKALSSAPAQLKYTIKQIGQAIKNGSHYVPIIKHAQALASRAGPKDYLGQIKQLYDDFVKRWRYVRDPLMLETLHVSGRAIYGQVLGFDRRPPERGAGDCDDAAAGIGSELRAIGLPVRVVTTAQPRGDRSLFSHVFVQAHVPRLGWYTVDPVGYPKHGPGWTPPHSRIAFWDLDGKLIGHRGQFPTAFRAMLGETENIQQGGIDMNYQGLGEFHDYGLGDWAGDGEPADWAVEGLVGFGAYSPHFGVISGDQTGLLMEFDADDEIVHPDYMGLVRTKMLEMDPFDYELVSQRGYPRIGSVALGDDGDVYQYVQDPSTGLGFFKKLFRKVKKAVKKGVKWVGAKAKRLISRLPGGKYLVKLHNRIHKIAMKIARPLVKYVGKYAKKLAPIAAIIPGYGPAIAGALYTAGRIAQTLKRYGVVTDKKGRPKFKSGKQARAFKRALEREASKMRRKVKAKKRTRRKTVYTRRRSGSGRLLRMGTPEHRAYLRSAGLELDGLEP